MLAGLVLVALILVAGGSTQLGWAAPLLLVALSLVWFQVNKSMEGEVLWVISPQRGLTAADLAGLAGLVVAGWRVLVLARRRGSASDDL